jgi:hypothetical protein
MLHCPGGLQPHVTLWVTSEAGRPYIKRGTHMKWPTISPCEGSREKVVEVERRGKGEFHVVIPLEGDGCYIVRLWN